MKTIKKKKTSSINRSIQMKIARLTASFTESEQSKQELILQLEMLILHGNPKEKGTWAYWAREFLPFVKNPHTVKPRFTILAKKNKKLKFTNFSTLPIVNCDGMGDCAKWCYSLKAWRYPCAFFRQIQNTILLDLESHWLVDAFMSLDKRLVVRLFVDGDFKNVAQMKTLFEILEKRPDLLAYGYSKSFAVFLAYNLLYKLPMNYTLNLSSGSKYSDDSGIYKEVSKLSVVRGNFLAVDAGKNPSIKEVRNKAKQLGIKNVFVCPSKCGECVSSKGSNIHACGSLKTFKGSNIVIGIH